MEEEISYKIVYSKRKTVGIQINEYAEVIVKAPKGYPLKEIERIIESHEDWIRKNVAKMLFKINREPEGEPIYSKDLRELTLKARRMIPEKCAHYGERMGVDYQKITIRHQKSRWGSCSSKGNLNFNCLLMLMPEDIIDYVVVHELAHRKEMNHSDRFWKVVENILPDYKRRIRQLNKLGAEIQRRDVLMKK